MRPLYQRTISPAGWHVPQGRTDPRGRAPWRKGAPRNPRRWDMASLAGESIPRFSYARRLIATTRASVNSRSRGYRLIHAGDVGQRPTSTDLSLTPESVCHRFSLSSMGAKISTRRVYARRHGYYIRQRVRTSCAFPRSGASIDFKFRACLVARTGVQTARTDLDIPERSAKPLRRYLCGAAGAAQRHNGNRGSDPTRERRCGYAVVPLPTRRSCKRPDVVPSLVRLELAST
jgi:hypothetical protein